MQNDGLPSAGLGGVDPTRDKPHLHNAEEYGLASLWTRARNELESTRVTRVLTYKDLPEWWESENEWRGEMGLARAWRIGFFRRSIAELLASLLERGVAATTAAFWNDGFLQWWFNSPGERSAPPPLMPSLSRPKEKPYGTTLEYCEFANGLFIERIKERLPCLLPYIPRARYDPNDATAVHAYSQLLSAVSVILTSQRLDLASKEGARAEEILDANWIRKDVSDPFRFRFRSKFWPDIRYNYVGLRLRPILAQALSFQETTPWEARYIEQDLPLTEAAARTTSNHVEHTGLRRNDIELAVWCEVLARLVESMPNHKPVRKVTLSDAPDDMTPFGELPGRLRHLVRELEGLRLAKSSQGSPSNRFLGDENLLEIEYSAAETLRPGGEGTATLLPNNVLTPNLENSRLSLSLDWDKWPGESEWMDLDVIAVIPDSSASRRRYVVLDYIEIDAAVVAGDKKPRDYLNNESPRFGTDEMHLELVGTAWDSIRGAFAADRIERAFAEARIAQENTPDGNGCAFVLLVDLAG